MQQYTVIVKDRQAEGWTVGGSNEREIRFNEMNKLTLKSNNVEANF